MEEGFGDLPVPAPRRRRVIAGRQAEPGARYIRPARERNDGRVQRPRQRYFQDIPSQRKYYGVKHQIGFQRQFPLRDYTYIPLRRGSDASLQMYGATHKVATADQRLERARNLMTGRGMYQGRGGYWGRAFGNLFGMGDAGDKLGDMASGVISNVVPGGKQAMDFVSSDLGQGLGKLASSYTGAGMYKRGRGLYRGKGLYKGRGQYTTNGLIAGDGAIVPQFAQEDMKQTTITNREFIGDIYGPASNVSFQTTEYALNPGVSKLFGWLSQVAVNFEEYAIKQLIVTYKSTVADFASASGQVGQVIMATHYNPTADPFSSKEEMMLYEGGMSCKTTEHMQHGIECDPSKLAGNEYKFIRVGNLPPAEDLKEYDLGRLCMAITGTPATYANQIIGELWVSYTVVLRKPKIASGHAYNIKRDFYIADKHTTPNKSQPAPFNKLIQATRNAAITSISVPSVVQDMTAFNGKDNLLEQFPTATNLVVSNQFFHMATLTFDDTFDGCVRIRIVRAINGNVSGDPTLGLRQILTVSSDIPGQKPCINRFTDIPVVKFGTAAPFRVSVHQVMTLDNAPESGTPEGGTPLPDSRIDLELHLRITPPQNGVKNSIAFGWANANAVHDTWWKCEVDQYNTFLSVSDSGRIAAQDTLQLTDANLAPFNWFGSA